MLPIYIIAAVIATPFVFYVLGRVTALGVLMSIKKFQHRKDPSNGV